jgi:uracil-DNA glycosylase family 4
MRSDSGAVSWSVGNALALYAQAKPAPGPRWLILAEIPAAVVPPETAASNSSFNPFDGDAGKLLDNMLRAVRLHQTGTALLAPLVRRVGLEATPDAGFSVALATLMQAVQPDVVLVMGRLAAQSLLQSSEPFGKLRGQVHTLHGAPTIVTHDATYLLRSPLEKAKAWEDLCLAMRVV